MGGGGVTSELVSNFNDIKTLITVANRNVVFTDLKLIL